MSPRVRERLRVMSQGLDRNSYVRYTQYGRTYIFMEGRWWTSPDISRSDAHRPANRFIL